MQKTEIKQFTQLWSGMAEMYGKSVSDATVAMAFQALEKYELIDIKRAINAHVADPSRGQFLAKPADLIVHIDGDPESRALQAWTKTEQAIGRVGPHQSVVFDDPLVMACIEDMGGWIALCSIFGDEMPFKRTEFAKRYKGYTNKPPVSHPAKLIGIAEHSNMQHFPNYKADPVLIGSPDKALLVHQTGGTKASNIVSLSALLEKSPQRIEHKSGEDAA